MNKIITAPNAPAIAATLREHFAAQFMAAMIAANDIGEPLKDLARESVYAADCLIAELAKEMAG